MSAFAPITSASPPLSLTGTPDFIKIVAAGDRPRRRETRRAGPPARGARERDRLQRDASDQRPNGKRRLVDWKQNVAETTKAYRGTSPWDSSDHYAISIGFSFCLQAHGNQELDVENFIKPTIDALAAGLFCTNDQDVSAIERYNYDGSNFRYLFVHRLDDALAPDEEGVWINVSVEG